MFRPFAEDFRREDLALAIVSAVAGDVANSAYTCAERSAIQPKRIFFSGNFVSHPIMRHHLTLQWNKRHLDSHFFLCTKVCNLSHSEILIQALK